MKKLTPEELAAIRTAPPGRLSVARTAIHNLQAGEAILLEPSDWKQKRSPSQLISRIEKRTGKKYRFLKSLDEPGWVVERVK